MTSLPAKMLVQILLNLKREMRTGTCIADMLVIIHVLNEKSNGIGKQARVAFKDYNLI